MTQTKTMDLLETPFKAGSVQEMKKAASNKYLQNISTSKMLWHLVKRHKFGLVSLWAIWITAIWIFPPLPDILRSLVR